MARDCNPRSSNTLPHQYCRQRTQYNSFLSAEAFRPCCLLGPWLIYWRNSPFAFYLIPSASRIASQTFVPNPINSFFSGSLAAQVQKEAGQIRHFFPSFPITVMYWPFCATTAFRLFSFIYFTNPEPHNDHPY